MPADSARQRSQAAVRQVAAPLLRHDGERQRGGVFATERRARPLPGRGRAAPARRHAARELTLAELVERLPRAARGRPLARARSARCGSGSRRPSTPTANVRLRELEGMGGDLADFRGRPSRRASPRRDARRCVRHSPPASVTATCATNPAIAAGDNPPPTPRPIRAYTLAELDALEAELGRGTGRSCRSSPRPGCVRSNGRGSNGATSIAPGGC